MQNINHLICAVRFEAEGKLDQYAFEITKRNFKENLERLLNTRGWNKTTLVSKLGTGYSLAYLSRWISKNDSRLPTIHELFMICNALQCSADELLGLQYPKSDDNVIHYVTKESLNKQFRWLELRESLTRDHKNNIPAEIREEINLGILFFNEMLTGKYNTQTLHHRNGRFPKPGHTLRQLTRAFTVAIRSNALKIDYVERNTDYENKLLIKFQNRLNQVVVAHVPRLLNNNFIDRCGQIIRTELVAYLTARDVLSKIIDHGSTVGLGAGYSLLRAAELVTPNTHQFIGTTWLPLVVAKDRDRGFNTYSANDIATLLSRNYPGSRHFYRVFHEPIDSIEKAEAKIESIQNVFTSVVGFGKAGPKDKTPAPLKMDFYNYGENPPRLLRELYKQIQKEGLEKDLAGVLFGNPINEKGEEITSPEINKIISQNISSISLKQLQALAPEADIWLVAAGKHKSSAVFAAMYSGLINSLVIDEEIAEYLLEIPYEESKD